MNYLSDVEDFHTTILGVTRPDSPTLVSMDYVLERANFMNEELEEFLDAAHAGDIVGVADALADIIYVALGTAHMMALPFDLIWAAVQKANMAKRRGVTRRGNAVDAVKPDGWTGPEREIARAIAGVVG